MGSMGAQEIFDNFHQHATGSQGLSAAATTAQQLATKYQDRAIDIQKLIDGVRSGWTGDAAEEASQGLMPLADDSLATHRQLSTGQDVVSRQMGSFHSAVAEVQPVPPEPSMQNVITAVMTGQNPQPMLGQIVAHNAVSQSNVDAYSKYVSASRYNTTNLPLLEATMASPGAPVAAVTPPRSQTSAPKVVPHASRASGTSHTTSTSGISSRSGATPLNHTGATASSAVGHSSGPPQPSRTGSVAASDPSGPGADRTTTSSATPSTGTVPPSGTSSPPTGVVGGPPPADDRGDFAGPGHGGGGVGSPPGFGEPSPDDSTGDIGSRLRGTSGPGGGVPGATGLRRGPDVSGDGTRSGVRSGSGAGPLGEGSGSTAGPRGAVVGPPGEGEGAGPRSGAGAGAGAEEELAAERGLANTRDGAPGPGTAPVTAGRRGDGDTEHQRRYNYGEDPAELFGTDRKVIQPVLGETADQRAARDLEGRQ